MRKTVSILVFILLYTGLLAQHANPPFNRVFLPGEVSVITLTMNANDKQQLLFPTNVNVDTYYKASLRLKNSRVDTLVQPIGVRLRGNTSRNHPKKSLKIDFKEFGGEQFFDLKKLNLKPNNNDPSQIREYLTIQLYRNMNVPVARANYAELFINLEYMGLYLNVENIDDEFVDRRFGNESGNLYKCSWGATLDAEKDIYNNDLYELKTNTEVNDRSKLIALVKMLKRPSDDSWVADLEKIFDVDLYLRQLAVEAIAGHWDGYSYNINNYYLYENPRTGKIVFIPYDMDNTWGIDWVGKDWAKRSLVVWPNEKLKTPLSTRILAVDSYYDKYILYLYDVLNNWFKHAFIEPIANEHIELLAASVKADTYFTLTFGFKYADFLNSYGVARGGHVKYSIGDYIDTRTLYARNQLPSVNWDSARYVSNLVVYPIPSNGMEVHYKGELNKANLRIYNSKGLPVPFLLSEKTVQFTGKLPPGIYYFRSGSETLKFMVGY